MFGFNGKEKDNEVSGMGNQYDYGFRIYNSRLGKFLSVDPLTSSYPWYTPYQFSGNKPIRFIDLDGLEEADPQDNEGFWYGFGTSILTGTCDLIMYIANNPNHAGYGYSPNMPPPTPEQIQAYSINWAQQIDPYYQIWSFAESTVGMVQGVYQFGEGIYEGDGRKTAQALPSVLAAAGTVYGLRGLNLTQKIGVRKNLASKFYSKYGERNVESKLGGINFNKAVQTRTLKKGTRVQQWVDDETGEIGKYFIPEGGGSNIGVSTQGRTLKTFELTNDVKVLESTAADYKGNAGGDIQYFNPELKNSIQEVTPK